MSRLITRGWSGNAAPQGVPPLRSWDTLDKGGVINRGMSRLITPPGVFGEPSGGVLRTPP